MSATWKRAHEFGQPLTWIASGVSNVGSRFSSSATSVAPCLGLDDRELAELDPGACHRLPTESRRSRLEIEQLEVRDQWLHLVRGDVEDHQLLLGGRPDAVRSVRLGGVGDVLQHGSRYPADAGCHSDVEPAIALPVDADVVASFVRRWGGRPPVDDATSEVLVLQHLPEPLGAPVRDEELDPGPTAQPPIAVVAEDPDDAGPDVRHLLDGRPTPKRWATIGLVDSPPPTQTSKPGPCWGWTTPTNETSLTSCHTSWCGDPDTAVLNLRGRLENAGFPMKRRWISSIAGVPSTISSAAMPATGLPRITRGVSPHASAVVSPTPSSRCQMAGTSSMRIQCSCTFCRSVRSAVSRA